MTVTARKDMTPDERASHDARLANAATKRRRDTLIVKLAPDLTCAGCGVVVDSPSLLEVDHVDGATWSRRDLSSSARVAKYNQEHAAGVRLRALCRSCSGRDGALRRYAIEGAVRRQENRRR